MINKAIEILKESANENNSSFVPIKPIINYLVTKCEGDGTFAERVILEGKTVKECMQYVEQEIKKKLNNKNGHIPDPEVYDMAVEYYTSDEIIIEKPEKRIKDTSIISESKSKGMILPKHPKKAKEEQKKNQISIFDF
ncbi:MAG: PcfK-like family protein [Bacilli bacterium]|nr:PcfK-like family protein [Bacilli bacterium]